MKQLFCDCKTDEEKCNFFLSGRAVETGVIDAAISNDVAMAYHRCSEFKKETNALRAKIDAMEQQKPAGWQRLYKDGSSTEDIVDSPNVFIYQRPLCALPVWSSQAVLDVTAERRRQIEVEGWTPEHDDEHSAHALAEAAACYCLSSAGKPFDYFETVWPWERWWFKASGTRRDLVKAGALILAEVERLDRAAAEKQDGE